MRFIPLMVVLTLLISAFATEPKEKVEASSSGTSECTKAGGVLKKIGMAQTEVCAIPYSDAGKRCSDKADCIGVCVASYADGDGKATSGTCQAEKIPLFGCYSRVENGLTGAAICID